MTPGLYVVRIPARGNGQRLIMESVRLFSEESANGWCEFIKGQYPKDDVFVIERKPDG